MPFVCFSYPGNDSTKIQGLGSQVMQVTDQIWIIDLSKTWAYWQDQASTRGISVPQILQSKLSWALDCPREGVIPFPSFSAALADHPWKALLFFFYLTRHAIKGLHIFKPDLREVSWDDWWNAASAMTSSATLTSSRIMLAMTRLRITSPQKLQGLNPASLQRRFGKGMAQLWTWAFDHKHTSDFPWQTWQIPRCYQVNRWLEDLPTEWPLLVGWLITDLDTLSDQLPPDQRILFLSWDIQLHHRHWENLSIPFRRPLSLAAERGQHTTALIQARSALVAALRTQSIEPLMTGWRLVASEVITVIPTMEVLFESLRPDPDEEAFHQLENRVSVPLKRFDFQADWGADSSMRELSIDLPQTYLPGLLASAIQRPLLRYRVSKLIDPPTGHCEFVEATHGKWWTGDHAGEKRYYKVTTEKGIFWQFQDACGRWFCEGLWG